MIGSTLDDIDYGLHRSKSSSLSSVQVQHHRKSAHSSKRSYRSKSYSLLTDPCSVCLDDHKLLDTQLFPCRHRFHGECLIKWVQTGEKFNCPLCRQDIAHFIQMTGDRHLNQKLVDIWNERYLFCSTPQTTPDQHEKTCKTLTTTIEKSDKPSQIANVNSIENIACKEPEEPEKVEHQTTSIESCESLDSLTVLASPSLLRESTENDNEPPIDFVQFDPETNSPINKSIRVSFVRTIGDLGQQFHYFVKANLYLNSMLYPIYSENLFYNETDNELSDPVNYYAYTPIDNDSLRSSYRYQIGRALRDFDFEQEKNKPISATNNCNLIHVHEETFGEHHSNVAQMLQFTKLNVKGGIFAGLCAGSTTYLVNRYGYFSRSLFPILSETAPSVAIFFTAYEHLKKYLFHVDNEQSSYLRCFGERFVSAGIASSVAYGIHLKGGASIAATMLPFRFAAFFGTFELCKDLINKNHMQLNLLQVASSAAIGATVSHSLYYPLSKWSNSHSRVLLQYSDAAGSVPISRTMRTLSKGMKGCMSSFSKFLPSCVVCSCAFEYSTRYLKSH